MLISLFENPQSFLQNDQILDEGHTACSEAFLKGSRGAEMGFREVSYLEATESSSSLVCSLDQQHCFTHLSVAARMIMDSEIRLFRIYGRESQENRSCAHDYGFRNPGF